MLYLNQNQRQAARLVAGFQTSQLFQEVVNSFFMVERDTNAYHVHLKNDVKRPRSEIGSILQMIYGVCIIDMYPVDLKTSYRDFKSAHLGVLVSPRANVNL